jgi:hypothetical protein
MGTSFLNTHKTLTKAKKQYIPEKHCLQQNRGTVKYCGQ